MGYLTAFLSSIFFSFYIIPRKLNKMTPVVFSLYMSLGFFVSTTILYGYQISVGLDEKPSIVLLWSVLAGIIWATAFVAFVTSIDFIGLSRSNQWKNLQGPVGVFLSLFLLGEYTVSNPFFALLAAVSIFLSALFFTNTSQDRKKHLRIRGVYLASLSALGFGSVAVIQKYVTEHSGVYYQQVVWSFSIFISLLVFIVITRKLNTLFGNSKKDLLLATGAGVIYLGASMFQLISYKYIPAAIGFTIIQLNALWTISIGIAVFKEIDLKIHYRKVIYGFIFTLVGVLLLLFAKK